MRVEPSRQGCTTFRHLWHVPLIRGRLLIASGVTPVVVAHPHPSLLVAGAVVLGPLAALEVAAVRRGRRQGGHGVLAA